MNSILPFVLAAQGRGMRVFPCDPSDKRPMALNDGRRLAWGETATTDQEAARRLWAAQPDLNYGVAAKPSNLLIIDCDMPKPGALLLPQLAAPGVHTGEDALARITELLGVPYPFDTFTVETPSGGAHYYFANTTGEQMSQSSPVKGWIDIRSNGGTLGGYVIGPGSLIGGRPYRVRNPAPISDAPQWLLDLCRHREPPPAPPRPAGRLPGGRLDPLLEVFRNSAPGNQGNTLYWAACCAAKDGIDERDAIRGFHDNRPAPSRADEWTWRTIESTVRSAYRHIGAA